MRSLLFKCKRCAISKLCTGVPVPAWMLVTGKRMHQFAPRSHTLRVIHAVQLPQIYDHVYAVPALRSPHCFTVAKYHQILFAGIVIGTVSRWPGDLGHS